MVPGLELSELLQRTIDDEAGGNDPEARVVPQPRRLPLELGGELAQASKVGVCVRRRRHGMIGFEELRYGGVGAAEVTYNIGLRPCGGAVGEAPTDRMLRRQCGAHRFEVDPVA